MKEQEEDQEEDKNHHHHHRHIKNRKQPTRNPPMHHQRFLQKLPFKHQGNNSTIFVYRSSQGQLYIFKAAQSDRSDRIGALSNEFKVLQDLGQFSSNDNNNNNINVGATAQNNNNVVNNNQNNPLHENNNNNQQGLQQQQQQEQQGQDHVILHHPHLIQTYGYRTNFNNENQPYHVLVLEFCQNGSLTNAMESMKEVFNPFSCDQSFSTFLLSSASAPKQVQKQSFTPMSSHQSPSPISAQSTSNESVRFDRRGNAFTTLNLKIHIQVVRHLLRQLVSAISFIHSRGYYHGDVKLANILLDNEFNIKLTDFGSASQNHSAPPPANINQRSSMSAQQGMYKLTQPHVAPEAQRESENCCNKYDGQKADIFSLGVVFFCLMFNQYPFSTTAAQCFNLSSSNAMTYAWQQVQAKVNYLIHQHPSEDILNLIELISSMLNEDPLMRPTIFEVEESSWMNSTETIEVPQAIKQIQLAQQQERQRISAQLEYQNKLKQQQITLTQSASNCSSEQQKCSDDDMIEIEEEKLNSQGSTTSSSKKDPFLKESQLYRLQEAKERQQKENLHTQSSSKMQEKETTLSQVENSSYQNSGEAVD